MRRWSALIVAALLVSPLSLLAQMSGTYTIGSSGTYATIEAAITALNGAGVSGPVTFTIASGTYTPPSTGYVLGAVNGMSATNTVTFRPASGASVTVSASQSLIFDINGGSNFILDGSNVVGGTTRNWKVTNSSTSGSVVRFLNGASNNIVRNMNLIGGSTSTTGGIVRIESTTGATGNGSNLISRNTIGDSSGTTRSATAIYMSGSTTNHNRSNVVANNDIINFGTGSSSAYAFYISGGNRKLRIDGNDVRLAVKTGTSSVGSVYGVYFSNSSGETDTIQGNRFYDLVTANTSTSQYGVYIWLVNATTLTVRNNMIALAATSGTLGGIYNTEPDSLYIDNNSVHISGENTTSSTTSYAFYNSAASKLWLRNNIFVNERTSTGTNTNRVVYYSSTPTVSTIDRNLLQSGGATAVLGYKGGIYYTNLTDWQNGTGYDLNSASGNPQFVSASTGDLHISTTDPTPVESQGMAITGLTTDFDGQARHATTPDIGADEGTFRPLFANDVAVAALVSPADGGLVRGITPFTPQAIIENRGSSTQTFVVRLRILNGAGTVVYGDEQTVTTLTKSETRTIDFSINGSITGTTSLTGGSYRVEVRTLLATDQDVSSDTLSGSFTVREPLNGIYTIDPNGSGSRNFRTFTAAVSDLSTLGIAAPVTFQVVDGVYDGTTETFPIVINEFEGGDASTTVTFEPATGATVELGGSATSIVTLSGADFVHFDGDPTGSAPGRFRIVNTSTSGTALRFIGGATNNRIERMMLIGGATSSTVAIIRFETSTAADGNSNNVLRDNTIGDPDGQIRSTTGIYMTGSSAARNRENLIVGNDIVNFGNSSTSYGIYVSSYNELLKVIDNDIHIPVKGGTESVSSVRGIYLSNSYTLLDTFAFNRIFDLSTADDGESMYGFYILTKSVSPLWFHGNMISIVSDGTGTLAGIYNTEPDTLIADYNSVRIAGTNGGSSSSYVFYNSGASKLWMRNNVFVNERSGTGTNTARVYYLSTAPAYAEVSNNVLYHEGNSTVLGYRGSYYTTLEAWQGVTGFDGGSLVAPVPFVDPVQGDLHIDPRPVFAGEGMGLAVDPTVDMDGEDRDAQTPDIGADEGNFNGGGLLLVSPNGGEKISVNYTFSIPFTANRALPAAVDLSLDGGLTWTRQGTVTAVAGTNSFQLTTPDSTTTRARVRVISMRNEYEADTSDADFEIVRPILTVMTPNGGEQVVPTDTVRIGWSSLHIPPTHRVAVDLSTDGGATFTQIAGGLTSPNLPAVNSIDWIVPSTPTTRALVRVRVDGGRRADTSDALFTILPEPRVSVSSPNGGERFVAGDTVTVGWNVVTTSRVRLAWSSDAGATWRPMVAGDAAIPAFVGSYAWIVPNVPTETALVRIVDADRPRFNDVSDDLFAITSSSLALLSPNGGEKFEMGEEVVVNWQAPGLTTLRLDYSTDNGATWTTVRSGINAASGSTRFTPVATPTKLARIRLVDLVRPRLFDVSDAPFEIMPEKSITLYAPTAGEKLVRGATTVIVWDAPRVERVDVLYSSDGGSTWQTLASGVDGVQGSYVWTVPSQLTDRGVVRVREVGGSLVGESGRFSIVAPENPVVRVITPNGGESYTAGTTTKIRWTAALVNRVDLSYSTNSGQSWQPIVAGLPAAQGVYDWTLPAMAGTTWRVRVVSANPAVSDISDADFTVTAPAPTLQVVYPNGGESVTVDSTVVLGWTGTDLSGDVRIELSTDAGGSWRDLATVPALPSSYSWTVDGDTTTRALLRVSTVDGLASDMSDATWQIVRPTEAPITVLTPNGGETWKVLSSQTIRWTAPESVTMVDIDLSVDGGLGWTSLATSVASSGGAANFYALTVPIQPQSTSSALVRIRSSVDGSLFDVSDGVFNIDASTDGVAGPVTSASGLRLDGAFPNPAGERTTIRWSQPRAAEASVALYTSNGQMVARRDLGSRGTGSQEVTLGTGELAGGMYIYELRVGSDVVRGTVVVVR